MSSWLTTPLSTTAGELSDEQDNALIVIILLAILSMVCVASVVCIVRHKPQWSRR
jgi:hypothetical protein